MPVHCEADGVGDQHQGHSLPAIDILHQTTEIAPVIDLDDSPRSGLPVGRPLKNRQNLSDLRHQF